MLLRRISDYVLKNRLQALAAAFFSAFIPVIGSISIVIGAFVTLRKDMFEGALVVFAATLPIILSYLFFPGNNGDVGLSVLDLVVLMVISNLLTWLFAVLLKQYSSWSLLLQVAAVISIACVAVVHLIYPNIQEWWSQRLSLYFAKTMKMLGDAGSEYDTTGTELEIKSLINAVKPYLTGIVIAFVAFNALLQVFLARWWQAAVFNPGGLRQEFLDIRMNYALSALFVLTLALGLYQSTGLLTDIMPILYVLFALAGLSLIHAVLAIRGTAWFWLLMIYGGMILYPFLIILIAMVGLLDTWVDFRKKIRKFQ